MSAFDDSARLVWSLNTNGPLSAITASGNSGGWTAAPVPPVTGRSAVDLRRADDIWLSVYAGAVTGTTPSLTVSLGFFDDQGNLFPAILSCAALTGTGGKVAFGGRHSSATYFVCSEWAQIAWAVTGTTPSFSALEIALYAR